ncbi:hypothetical protein C5167_050868 [Papaver somniferum]|uniref:Uncharacterized protein n=1 Tax=Papaver somniferum TaxID=3469 RepID=A0A4Y7KSK8_PAPSO|nr:hypothetical protein C5167_050868 [Papaver somniferum]
MFQSNPFSTIPEHTPSLFYNGFPDCQQPFEKFPTAYKTFSHIGEAEEGTKCMTRVRISIKWNELDFMATNEVTSLDDFMLDDNVIVQSSS